MQTAMRLKDKIALVTGASKGIGRAIALGLAREGATLVLHHHQDEAGAQQTLAGIEASGSQAKLFEANFRNRENVQRLGAAAWDAFGGIDLLVNNAGISWKKHFLDQQPEDIDAFTDINFKAPLYLTQIITHKMIAAGRPGSICSITSINGIQPGVGHSVYGATKGALETLMKGIALELAPHGITVNTVAPGGIRTDLNAAVWKDPALLQQVSANIPLGRLGEPEEVALVVVNLLASASYVTGVTITVDGGWLLKHGYQNPYPYTK